MKKILLSIVAIGLVGTIALLLVPKKEEAITTQPYVEEEGTMILSSEAWDMSGYKGANEFTVLEALHFMSHSKIKADRKWGNIPITTYTISEMRKIIAEGDYEHKQMYLEMLRSWENGKTEKSDTYHNFIWELQNGTVGRATGVMDREEQIKYINKTFGEEYVPEVIAE